MTKIKCKVSGLSQRYQNFYLFKDLSFSISSGEIWIISGNNGAGKSSLLKILSNGIEPYSGDSNLFIDEKKIEKENIWKYLSLVAPYQELPEELSLIELIRFQNQISDPETPVSGFEKLIKLFELENEINRPLGQFSTGMGQKCKIILAIGMSRPIILLDEPTSNLDASSFDKFWNLVEGMKEEHLIIVATNDEKELSKGKLLLRLG
jgi:ABC-type multidrug transport system ATPase subunit